MRPSKVAKFLGISPDRIKYFKKKGVFTPERPPVSSKSTDYTERDVAELKKLVILSKLGLTCGDIRKLQDGSWTLEEAVVERCKAIKMRWNRMSRSIALAEIILKDNAEFDTFDSDYYWDIIIQREAESPLLANAQSAQEETL